jgi:outer membrane lipoprotein-sorting protein
MKTRSFLSGLFFPPQALSFLFRVLPLPLLLGCMPGASLYGQGAVHTPDAGALLERVRGRLEQVNDYQATGLMKTNVSFLKVPDAQVTIYFKRPDKLKIKNEKGISLVPKGAVTISLNNLLKGKYTTLDAGTDTAGGQAVKVIKLLPQDENADLVLSTLYIDESRLLILKARTTTRENGTYEVDMSYGKYSAYALPDKVIFTFNTKDYKLPKGLTFDYDDGSAKKEPAAGSSKGKVEISYSSYIINRGLPETVFQ